MNTHLTKILKKRFLPFIAIALCCACMNSCSLFKKSYTISRPTLTFLKHLEAQSEIKLCFSSNLPREFQSVLAGVQDIAREFQAHSKGNIKVTTIGSGQENVFSEYGLPELQVQTIENATATISSVYMGIVVLSAGKFKTLPVVSDLGQVEYWLCHAIALVAGKTKPFVGVYEGDSSGCEKTNDSGQTSGTGRDLYKPIYDALTEDYTVVPVSDDAVKAVSPEPEVLVVPGSDAAHPTKNGMLVIDQLFMKKSNLLVLADAVVVNTVNGAEAHVMHSPLLDLVAHYGLMVEPCLVLDASCGQVQIPQNVGAFSMNVNVSYPFFVKCESDTLLPAHPGRPGAGGIILPWPSPVTMVDPGSDTSRKSIVLVRTSPNSWVQKDSFNLNPQQEWAKNGQEAFEQRTLAACCTGNFTSYYSESTMPEGFTGELCRKNSGRRLVVVGNSRFITSANATPENIRWMKAMVDWMALDEIANVPVYDKIHPMIQRYNTARHQRASLLAKLIRVFTDHFSGKNE